MNATRERPTLMDRSPPDDYGRIAADCISLYVESGKQHAELCGKEMELAAEKPGKYLAAIQRMMQTEQPLVPGKLHSASSADKLVETDPDYRAHLDAQAQVVVMKNTAFVLARAADLRAQLALARFKVAGGLQ